MTPPIFNWKDLNPEKDFRFAPEPFKNKHDGQSLPLRILCEATEREEAFIHQGPKMTITFGIVGKELGGRMQYKVSLSFTDVLYNPDKDKWTGPEEMVKYLKFMQDIDEFNMEYVHQNLNPGKKKKEVMDDSYFRNVWIGDKCKTGEYPPTLSTKLMVRRDQVVTDIFDNNANPKDFASIEGDASKGLTCIPLLKTTGLWFAGRNFGMSFSLLQLVVYERDRFVGCAVNIPEAINSMKVPRGLGDGSDEDSEEGDYEGQDGEEGDDDDEEEVGDKRGASSSSRRSKRQRAVDPKFNL